MRINEKLKAEIREKLDGVILAIKVAKTVEEHEHPDGGDAVVEVLTEEISKLHSDYGKELTVCCGVDRDEFEERTVREAGPYENEQACCDESCECSGDCENERTDGLDFGAALRKVKKGARIARKGWNGKGQFVFLADDLEFHTDADLSVLEGEVYVHGALAFSGTSGIQVGWLASQADMLSDDWYIVE